MRPSSNVEMMPDSANTSTLNETKVSLGFKWLRIEKKKSFLNVGAALFTKFRIPFANL